MVTRLLQTGRTVSYLGVAPDTRWTLTCGYGSRRTDRTRVWRRAGPRAGRRGKGKSDPIDAHLAVLAALRLDAGHLAVPRGAQPSFTAVPEALTISMLFPTVS